MWENAGALIGVPAAIKATLEVIELLRKGSGQQKDAEGARSRLESIEVALDHFANDAVELAALKDLHALTNQFMIDLRYTFAMVGPDPTRSREHWATSLENIRLEFMTMQEGQRAAAQLAALRADPLLMRHLRKIPDDVRERVPVPPWDQYFWDLLRTTNSEVDNFANFNRLVGELRTLNSVLNNYADRNLKVGIGQLDGMMKRLKIEIERARSK